MTIYLAFLIPFIVAAALYFIFKHKVVLWEVAIPVVATAIIVLIAKWICVSSLTSDTEYLGGYVQQAQFFEDWDERVSCRHPKYCEEEDDCCSRNTKGECQSCTKRVQCGYEHSYDVDYHPEYWVAKTTLGEIHIDESKYNYLVHKFKMKPVFRDLDRDYHSKDGDEYFVDWDQDDVKLEAVTLPHSYENRPQGSSGIYHYEEVDTADISTYKPFRYPDIENIYGQQMLLGYNDAKAQWKLEVMNSKLGATKQIRVYIIIFKNQPREAGFIQQRYWQNGNKNELVVCVGLDSQEKVKWSNVFSWTEQVEVKNNIKRFIDKSSDFKLHEYISTIETEVNSRWVRKRFRDFNYLEILPTPSQTIVVFIIVILLNGGLGYWIVANEYSDEHKYGTFRLHKKDDYVSKFLKKLQSRK